MLPGALSPGPASLPGPPWQPPGPAGALWTPGPTCISSEPPTPPAPPRSTGQPGSHPWLAPLARMQPALHPAAAALPAPCHHGVRGCRGPGLGNCPGDGGPEPGPDPSPAGPWALLLEQPGRCVPHVTPLPPREALRGSWLLRTAAGTVAPSVHWVSGCWGPNARM